MNYGKPICFLLLLAVTLLSGVRELKFIRSRQQGLSTDYATPNGPSRLRGIYPNERMRFVIEYASGTL
jgi:hypothetical protein